MTITDKVSNKKAVTVANPNKIDWDAIFAKLPTEKTNEQKARRKRLFSQFDANGNGLLSLAEVDKAIIDVLNCPQI